VRVTVSGLVVRMSGGVYRSLQELVRGTLSGKPADLGFCLVLVLFFGGTRV
jgi:hypothetical protein